MSTIKEKLENVLNQIDRDLGYIQEQVEYIIEAINKGESEEADIVWALETLLQDIKRGRGIKVDKFAKK